MPIVIIALIFEILASSLLVSLPAPKMARNKVLGQSVLLAEDETPSPDQTTPSDQAPPDQTPLPPADNSAPSETAPTDQTQPASQQPTPSETAPQPAASPSSTQTSTETQNAPAVETPPSSPEAQTTAQETPEQSASLSANLPIMSTNELINDVSQIDTQSQQEAATEDSQLAQIIDPNLRATALTTFASDKISDIDKFTRDQDFNSAAFSSQRLSDQIDQLKVLSSKSPANGQIQQKLSDLCQQANTTLRTNQEIVPEELEQDLEITRGQCLGY